MSKLLYLSILLSFLLIKSETTFGQTQKKQSEICGKIMSTILTTDPKLDPALDLSSMLNDEFCDSGRYEENANFIISFYNAKNKFIYDKHVYLNEYTFVEQTNSKGDFIKTKILPSTNSRIIKVPINNEMGEVHSYKIQSLIDNKTFAITKIKW